MKKIYYSIALLLATSSLNAQSIELVKNIAFNDGVSSAPKSFFVDGSKMFFSSNDGTNGEELWITDGTTGGTAMLKDIYSGNNSSNPSGFFALNGKVFFTADNGTNGRELWVTDGTSVGTHLFKDIHPTSDSNPANFIKYNDKVYFAANDGTNGEELWVTDGTEAGTLMFMNIANLNNTHPELSSNPNAFHIYNNKLFFAANNQLGGMEPWISDGTTAGTNKLLDITGNNSHSNPQKWIEMGGLLYFQASTVNEGTELWVTDGTAENTHIVKDIYAGSESSLEPASEIIAFNNKLFFYATNGGPEGTELWWSDGTELGTKFYANVYMGGGISSFIHNFHIYNSRLYFFAIPNGKGRELMSTSGTTSGYPTLVKDINPGIGDGVSNTAHLIVNDKLLFVANDGDNGQNLWVTDGTEAGTTMIAPSIYTASISAIGSMVLFNGAVYFSAIYDASVGMELYKMSISNLAVEDVTVDKNISMYPNPATNLVNIELPVLSETSTIQIIDLMGRTVLTQVVDGQKVQINTSELKVGQYIVKVTNENYQSTSKLIIK